MVAKAGDEGHAPLVDRSKALLAEHRRRAEGSLVRKTDVADHPAARVDDALLLTAGVGHHDVVAHLLRHHRVVRAHHDARAPLASPQRRVLISTARREVYGDAEARLKVILLGGDSLLLSHARRCRVRAATLLRAAAATLGATSCQTIAVSLLALRLPTLCPLLLLFLALVRRPPRGGVLGTTGRRRRGLVRHAHLGRREPTTQRQADRAHLVGALAVVPHQALRQSTAGVGALVPSAARARVVRDESLRRRAFRDGAVCRGALHHVREDEQVVCLGLRIHLLDGRPVARRRADPHMGGRDAPVRQGRQERPRLQQTSGSAAAIRAADATGRSGARVLRRALPASDQGLQLPLGCCAVGDDAGLPGGRDAVLSVDEGEGLEPLADGALRLPAFEEVCVDLLHLVAVRHRARRVLARRRMHEDGGRGNL
jgi:hypothetical protein